MEIFLFLIHIENMKHFKRHKQSVSMCQKQTGEKEWETLLFNYNGTDMENGTNLKSAQ